MMKKQNSRPAERPEISRKNQQNRRFRRILAGGIVLLIAAGAAFLVWNGALDRHGGNADGGAAGTDADSSKTVQYNGKEYVYNDKLSNYLFIGVDQTGDIHAKATPGDAGQSDALFLVSYNRAEQTVRALAIPRDTMTMITTYNTGGEKLADKMDHLSLQYAYGTGGHSSAKLTAEAVSNLLNGIRIDGYTAFNMDVIPKLTELAGTVRVVVPNDSLAEVDPSWTKGAEITLDASNTEQFVRSRDINKAQTAISRMERQKVFIKAFAEQIRTRQAEDPHTVVDLYDALKPELVTNMGSDVYVDLAGAEQPEAMETLPGEAVETDLYDEYHIDEDSLYDLVIRMFYVEA